MNISFYKSMHWGAILVSGALLIFYMYYMLKASSISTWPKTMVTIQNSGMRVEGHGKGVNIRLTINGEYSVNGTIVYGQMKIINPHIKTVQFYQSLVDKYRVGERMTLRYNPNNYAIITFEDGVTLSSIIQFCVVLMLFSGLLYMKILWGKT